MNCDDSAPKPKPGNTPLPPAEQALQDAMNQSIHDSAHRCLDVLLTPGVSKESAFSYLRGLRAMPHGDHIVVATVGEFLTSLSDEQRKAIGRPALEQLRRMIDNQPTNDEKIKEVLALQSEFGRLGFIDEVQAGKLIDLYDNEQIPRAYRIKALEIAADKLLPHHYATIGKMMDRLYRNREEFDREDTESVLHKMAKRMCSDSNGRYHASASQKPPMKPETVEWLVGLMTHPAEDESKGTRYAALDMLRSWYPFDATLINNQTAKTKDWLEQVSDPTLANTMAAKLLRGIQPVTFAKAFIKEPTQNPIALAAAIRAVDPRPRPKDAEAVSQMVSLYAQGQPAVKVAVVDWLALRSRTEPQAHALAVNSLIQLGEQETTIAGRLHIQSALVSSLRTPKKLKPESIGIAVDHLVATARNSDHPAFRRLALQGIARSADRLLSNAQAGYEYDYADHLADLAVSTLKDGQNASEMFDAINVLAKVRLPQSKRALKQLMTSKTIFGSKVNQQLQQAAQAALDQYKS